MKDLIRRMDLHQPTFFPILHYNGKKPASKTDKLQNINASKQVMSFEDSAVFIHARMDGHVDIKTKSMFYALNNRLNRFTKTIKLKEGNVDVEARNFQVKRKKVASQLEIVIKTELWLRNDQQAKPMTLKHVQEIESAFNRKLTQDINSFIQLGKDHNWDLLGIQDEDRKVKDWRKLPISFHVKSKVTAIGNISSPYKPYK